MKRSASPNGNNGAKLSNNVTPQKRSPVYSLLPPLSQPKSSVSSDFARIEKLYQGQNKKQKQVSDSGPPKVLSGSCVRLQKDYFQKYETLIKYEIEDQMKDIEERHSKWPKSRLEREGVSLFNLKAQFKGYLFHESLIVFKRMDGQDLPFHRFSHGDMVMVSCTGMSGSEGKMGQLIDGVVAEKSKATITISTSTAFEKIVLENNIWRLDQAANRVSFDRMLASLRNFCSSDGFKCTAFKDFIIGNVKDVKQFATQSPPSWLASMYAEKNWPKEFEQWKLNNCQRNVIRKALQNKITLIQGPPGTGKTHTAVHLVKLLVHCLKQSNKKVTILCAADTNVAVDNLLEGMADLGIKALRVGKPVKIREELRDLSLDAKLLDHSENGQLGLLRYQRDELIRKGITTGLSAIKQNIKSIEARMSKEVMDDVEVICATCIGAAAELLDDYTFPVVLIDECTQATEPAAMCAIVKGAEHLVLLGDHFQLPPTVTSARAQAGGLAMSIFERFINLGIESNLLQIQYRMHPSISEFPSQEFYKGKIADGIRGEDRPAPNGFDWPDKSKPVAFISVQGNERISADGVSKYNVEEAELVMNLVNGFLDEKMCTREIGVITPYTGQVTYLKSMFDSRGGIAKGQKYHKLTIHSVDGFQGREKEVILFSTVRSNDDGNIGFLRDWRRLNVALTRARRGIIVIGSKETLMKDARWAKWLSWVEMNKLEKLEKTVEVNKLLELSQESKEEEVEEQSH